LVLGLLNGLTVGLLAVGLVLVYKSNRFINLAHAQMGTLSALLLAKWVLDWGWNWWVAFGLAVAVGLATGLFVERFLVRRLRRRTTSPVALLLLSIGVSQLLLALTYIPSLGPNQDHSGLFPQPFESHLRIGHVVLTGMSVLTMVLVPVVVLALAAFLRYSLLGKQIRAAANNRDAARLCGVSVSRVSAVTWGLAGSLAAVSAVLAAPSQPSFDVAAFGPYLLMFTLGAAALGAFVSLPAALGGGLLLGVVGQAVSAQTSDASKGELAVFATILLIVLVRGRAISAVFALSGAATQERPLTRVPEVLRASPLVRYHRWWLATAALFVALVVPELPYFHTQGHRFLLVLVLVYALVGVALTMLIGWGGQVSLGHFAVVGLGAYVTAQLAAHGWSLPAMLLVAGAIGAAVMVVVGLPALRVRGLTLAVTTLGLAVISSDWLFHQPWLASADPFGVAVKPARLASGLGTPRSQLSIYLVALVVLASVVAATVALRHSAPGRLVIAVRDNERAAAAFGVTPATVKVAILAVSGFVAAMAGVVWAQAWGVASPSQFGADVSVAVLAIPVIGGLGSVGGAVAAAVLLYAGTFFIGPVMSPVFGSYGQNLGFQLFLAGVLLVGVLLRFPTGLAGISQFWWQSFLDRRADRVGLGLAHPANDLPLVTSGVKVRFGGVVALDGPDVTVRPGEIVGLIGPNGAGKTTLMNVISGVITPDAGSVRLFGHEVVDLPADLRAAYGLARSFQDAALFAGLTVNETVQVALARGHKAGVVSAMLGAPWVRARERISRVQAGEIVERFGLTAWADTLTSDLSTGTRRICDLAAQVAVGPKLLLLDEPTAGVAQREAEAFGPLLRQIRDELDCAVVIVEHDMPLLMGLCDRVYAMDTGRVIAQGTPARIRHDPVVVASYLGTEEVAITRSDAGKPPSPSVNGRRPARSGRGAAPSTARPASREAGSTASRTTASRTRRSS
jgi:ABC-type branched-subunit amino acid transport system ATPase component/branched-subunit amino acid ABC-type transport system permease component